jgi:hypothetical protein
VSIGRHNARNGEDYETDTEVEASPIQCVPPLQKY